MARHRSRSDKRTHPAAHDRAPAADASWLPGRLSRWLAVAILVLLAVGPNLVNLWGEFHFDDGHVIVRNTQIRSFNPAAWNMGRWLATASFYLNYRLGGPDWMPGWHAVNIGLHALVVLALYATAGRLLPPERKGLAFWAAAIFAVHPLASEPVNYIQARVVPLYTLMVLLAVCSAAGARRATTTPARVGWLAACAGAVILAAMSKEAGVFFALAAVGLYVLVYLAPHVVNKRRFWLWTAGAAIGVAAGAAIWIAASGIGPAIAQRLGVNFVAHLYAQATIFWRYVGLAIVPAPALLNVDHYVSSVPLELGDGAVWASLLGLAALAAVAVWQARTRPAVAWALAMLPLGLLPYMLVPSAEPMVEYRFYLPLTAFCLLAALLAGRVFTHRPAARTAVLTGLCIVLAGLTAWRGLDWRTDLSLWRDAVAKSPRKARTVNALAWALARDAHHPDPKEAIRLAKRSLADPTLDLTGVNYVMEDTLAEAYYADGQFDRAVGIEQRILNWMDAGQIKEHHPLIVEQLAKFIAARDRAAREQIPAPATTSRPAE